MAVDFFGHSTHISPTDYPSPSPTPSHRVANAVVHVDPLGSSGLGERVRSQYRDHESVAKAVTQSVLGIQPTPPTRIIHHPHEPSIQSIHNLHDPFPFYIITSSTCIPIIHTRINLHDHLPFHIHHLITYIYSSIYP